MQIGKHRLDAAPGESWATESLQPPTGKSECEAKFREWIREIRLIVNGELDAAENQVMSGLLWQAWKAGYKSRPSTGVVERLAKDLEADADEANREKQHDMAVKFLRYAERLRDL